MTATRTSAAVARLFALKDALRVAIVMPVSFASGLLLADSPQTALFAAFGPMALLVFVQFGGTWRARLLAYVALALVGAGLISIGTLCSGTPWLATAMTAVLGFAIIFVGVFDDYAAAAQPAAILCFVLAVMVPAESAEVPARLVGWGLAAGLSTAAVLLLWPRRPQSAVRASAGVAAEALADLAEVSAAGDPAAIAVADASTRAAINEARLRFVSLPHRPSGNGGRTAALARTIEHMAWLRAFAARWPAPGQLLGVDRERAEIEAEVPAVLRQIAARLKGAPPPAGPFPERLTRVHRSLGEAVVARFAELPFDVDEEEAGAALDEAYRLRQISFGSVELCGDAAVACGDRTDDRRLRTTARVREARWLTRVHANLRSVWLRNSLRGAIGLALAVLVAELTDLQNGFWVVLGTMSVLRSNVLSTGTTIARALLGTLAGIVVGGLLIAAVGTDPLVLWLFLPCVVFLASYAPKAISFAVGQAAFSLFDLILFNLIDPIGWQVGLIRVQDVAVGAAVSLVAGLLIWPRGATAVLRRAIGAAYVDAAAYLDATIRSMLGGGGDLARRGEATFESAQILDTTLRAYLSEQSAGREGVEELGVLAAGASRMRRIGRLLAHAQALVQLTPVDRDLPQVAEARAAFELELEARCDWFATFGESIATGGPVPPPEPGAAAESFAGRVVLERASPGPPPGLAVAWAHCHLEVLREMETAMVRAATAVKH